MILDRVDTVRAIAARAGEQGIVDWAERARTDARVLGRLRTRDTETLERLEETFSHDFYRNLADERAGELEYA